MATQRRKVKKPVEVVEEVLEEDEEYEDEEENEVLPLGEDSSALFASGQEKIIEVVHAGKRWIFKYKEMTWGEKNACVDAAQTWDQNNGFNFSLSKYYAAALTRMLTETPIRPITETTLSKLDRAIGEQLVAIVPQPVEPNVQDLKGQ